MAIRRLKGGLVGRPLLGVRPTRSSTVATKPNATKATTAAYAQRLRHGGECVVEPTELIHREGIPAVGEIDDGGGVGPPGIVSGNGGALIHPEGVRR